MTYSVILQCTLLWTSVNRLVRQEFRVSAIWINSVQVAIRTFMTVHHINLYNQGQDGHQ